MDLLSPAHLILIFLIVVLLFGGRKIPEVMKGMGEGIRSFKEGMSGNPQTPPPAQAPPAPVQPPPSEEKKS
jgi:sec-independent protein translocase protein TatA